MPSASGRPRPPTFVSERIAEANRGQARGDSAVAEAWYSRGIRHYREAWDDPQDALHR